MPVRGRTAFAFLLALALAPPALAAGAPAPPEPGPARAAAAVLRLAQAEAAPARDLVRAVQEGLAALGYDPGPIDGVAGPKTRAAIGDFQTAAGLAPDGAASPALLARLNAALEAVKTEALEPAAEPAAPREADFVAAWLLGTWRIDCARDDPGLVFDRIAYDKTWSEEWTVTTDGANVSVCREAGGRFCYHYRRLGESRLVYDGYVGQTGRAERNIEVEKCG